MVFEVSATTGHAIESSFISLTNALMEQVDGKNANI